MAQKTVLGKGLASLFPSMPVGLAAGAIPPSPAISENMEGSVNRDRHPGISLLKIDEIQINPYQPRREFDELALQELAQSIQSNGIIQPLVVRKMPNGSYQLIAGERRLRAARRAGVQQVPIVIRKSTDRESLELALIENIQRQNLNCIDEALAYFQLTEEFQLTQEEVARQVGKDRATVANHLRLLRLPEAIIDDLKKGALSFGHGKALLSVEDHELRLRARAVIVEKRLSVRDSESLIEEMKQETATQAGTQPLNNIKKQSPLAQRLQQISHDLTHTYSAKVKVQGNENKGKIVIHYSSRQELDRLLDTMQNHKA